MVRMSCHSSRTALFASAASLAALLTACGSSGDASTASSGAPAPSAAAATGTGVGSPSSDAPAPQGTVPAATGGVASGSAGSRCHTSQLRASLGTDSPGAGQEHFPVVLTNTSGRTCTVAGFPGAAFIDDAGRQLGPDPARVADRASLITLAPRQSAWSGLSFTNPEVSGAKSAKPAWLLVTPPDERDFLRVPWTGGTVPVSGTASQASLTVLAPGTGA
jgi:hypothetical protein